MKVSVKDVDTYIALQPAKIRTTLKKLRQTVKKAAPDAFEVISYGMPAYKLNGMLLYFAAHQKHIGFYPFTTAITAFKKELSKFETSRGTVKFPFEKPVPFTLISKMVKFRVKENLTKLKLKKKKK